MKNKGECEDTYYTVANRDKKNCKKDKLCSWDLNYNDGLGKCIAILFKG